MSEGGTAPRESARQIVATLRTDIPVGTVDDLCWQGPTPEFAPLAAQLDANVGEGRGMKVKRR